MDENYQKYLDLIQNFYISKNNYLTNKEKYMSCKGCDKKKLYVENNKEILLNCGDKGKCGDKIKIILPKYIYKDNEIKLLKSELEKVINWDIISKYIKLDKKFLDDNKELLEKNNKQIQEIKNKYYEVYKKNNVNFINEKYKEILKLKLECTTIKEELNDISLSNEDKKLKRQDYIEHITNMDQLYSEIRENIDNIKEYYLEDEPKIILDNLDFIEEEKLKKKKKKKKKKKVSLDDFEEGMNVEFTFKDKTIRGVIHKIDPALKTKVIVKIGEKESKVPISKLTIIKKEEVKEPKEEVEKPKEEVKEPKEVVKVPKEEVEKPKEEVKEPKEEEVKEPKEEVEEPKEEVKEPKEEVEEPKEEVKEPKEEAKEPKEEVEKPAKKLSLEDFKEGMNVIFNYKDVDYKGVVKNINKEKNKVLVTIRKKDKLIPMKKLTILD